MMFFAGEKIRLAYVVEGLENPVRATFRWSLHYESGVLARGERAVDLETDPPGSIVIPLQLPETREGLTLPATLLIRFHQNDDLLARRRERIYIYPRKYWETALVQLAAVRIGVVDLSGKMRDLFETRVGENVRVLERAESVDAFDGDLLICAENLEGKGPLVGRLVRKARNGVSALCLAQTKLVWRVADLLPAQSLACRDPTFLMDLDKRFEVEGLAQPPWNAGPALTFDAIRSSPTLKTAADAKGFVWVEVKYAPSGAILACCQLPLVDHFQQSPAPQVLLVRLIEYLTKDQAETAAGHTRKTGDRVPHRRTDHEN